MVVSPRRAYSAFTVLLALTAAVPTANARTIPLRDGRVTSATPRVGWAYACSPPRRSGKASRVPWISGSRLNPAKKPVINGSVRWPTAAFSLSEPPGRLAFSGNGQPVSAPTGVFPVTARDDAARYAADAAALAEKTVSGSVPRPARRTTRSHCIDAGQPVGVSTRGTPILPAFDAAGHDALAHEVQDRCGGRTDAAGLYYLRAASRCQDVRRSPRSASPLIGYARDGFPIYGSHGSGGRVLHNRDLDACHGRLDRVRVGGHVRRVYRYHLTSEFPYTIGCFRGKPATDWSIAAPDSGAGEAFTGPVTTPTIDTPPAETTPAADPPPAPPPPPDEPSVTAQPDLLPAFDPGVTDYVTRCDGNAPVEVNVHTPDGTQVAVDGTEPASGDFTRPVALDTGQRFDFTTTTPSHPQPRAYHVRCLPSDFPSWNVERSGQPQAEWYLTSPAINPTGHYLIIFDTHGVPVWWYDAAEQTLDFKLLPNGNLIWFEQGAGEVERSLDGALVRQIQTVGSPTDGHDVQLLPNGDYALITYPPRDHVDLSPWGGPSDATVLDSEIQEIDADGNVVWSWNTKDHIGLDESAEWYPTILGAPLTLSDGRQAYDIVHMNAIEVRGNEVVTSLRHTDAVYSFAKNTGAINWKLGGTTTPQSLTFVGDPYGAENFAGQHDPRILPDGTLTVHDNGTHRKRAPRAVRYRIDPAARTATLVEDVRDSEAPGSICCGSARRLSGGDWVAGWGGVPNFAELTPAGQPVFRITFSGTQFSYRTVPLEPGALSRDDLRTGMDAQFPRP
jgi:Arylsulfotransferase (ASST)